MVHQDLREVDHSEEDRQGVDLHQEVDRQEEDRQEEDHQEEDHQEADHQDQVVDHLGEDRREVDFQEVDRLEDLQEEQLGLDCADPHRQEEEVRRRHQQLFTAGIHTFNDPRSSYLASSTNFEPKTYPNGTEDTPQPSNGSQPCRRLPDREDGCPISWVKCFGSSSKKGPRFALGS